MFHRPFISAAMFFCVASTMATHAAEILPDGVRNPFGLDPRLALMDHIREVMGLEVRAGMTYEEILAVYEVEQQRRSSLTQRKDSETSVKDPMTGTTTAAKPAASDSESIQGTRFDCKYPFLVYGWPEEDGSFFGRQLGMTPSPNGEGVFIPPGTRWYVMPIKINLKAEEIRQIADIIETKKIDGLCLSSVAGLRDEDLVPLKVLADMRVLLLNRTHITDSSMAIVREMKGLEVLHLGQVYELTDVGIAQLSTLTAMRVLNLAGTGVTDAGLSALSSMTELRELYLWETRVTDALAELLRGLSHLKKIEVALTHVTPAGLQALKEAIPSLQ